MALWSRTWLWCGRPMFIGAEVRLGLGFNAAKARLANLACSGLLRRASDDAYRELGSGLARVGPPGMSKLVTVRFSEIAVHEDFAVAAMRWEATGPGGALFPALDADIRLTQAGQDATVLVVCGVYRPPFGSLGRRTGPGGFAPDRPGDHPDLHPSPRGLYHGRGRLARRSRHRPAAGIPALA
jgi:hypothetical protein